MPSNDLQRAIIRSLANRVECIQGPLGTGKSTTIFHILQNRLPDDVKAMVTCVQSKAVDSIAEKLGATDLRFVVFGNPSRLGDCAKRYTLDAQALRDPKVVEAKKELGLALSIEALLRARFAAASAFARIVDPRLPTLWRRGWEAYAKRRHSALRNDCDRYFSRAQTLRTQANAHLAAASARLLAIARAFLSSLASVPGGGCIAVIDEAGRVPEFKIPHLLSLGAQAVIAIGDQNQFQPFMHSKGGQEGYFQRVVRAIKAPMLRIQYRMHPAICDLVSRLFYGGKLRTAPEVAALRTAVAGGGVHWLDYPDGDAESPSRDKRCNMTEVRMVARFMDAQLGSLLAQGKTVAVITFYKHQLAQLMEAGQRVGYVRPEATTAGRFTHPNFRIVTVDAAQPTWSSSRACGATPRAASALSPIGTRAACVLPSAAPASACSLRAAVRRSRAARPGPRCWSRGEGFNNNNNNRPC